MTQQLPYKLQFDKLTLPSGKTLLQHVIECCVRVSSICEAELMYLCTFYHDIGKIDPLIIDKKLFKSHENKGTSYLKTLKTTLRLSDEEYECILFVKENHESLKKFNDLKTSLQKKLISSPFFKYLYVVSSVNDEVNNDLKCSDSFGEVDKTIYNLTNFDKIEIMNTIASSKEFTDFAFSINPKLKENQLIVGLKDDFKKHISEIKFPAHYDAINSIRQKNSKCEMNLPFGMFLINGDFIPLNEMSEDMYDLKEQDFVSYNKYEFCGYTINSVYNNWFYMFEYDAKKFIKDYVK